MKNIMAKSPSAAAQNFYKALIKMLHRYQQSVQSYKLLCVKEVVTFIVKEVNNICHKNLLS